MHLNSLLFSQHLLFASLTYCQLFHIILLLLCLVKLQSPLLFLRLLYCVKMLYCFVEHVPIIIKYHSVGIISFCKITPATTEVVLHDDMYPWRRRPLQHRNRIHILCLVHHRASWTDRQTDRCMEVLNCKQKIIIFKLMMPCKDDADADDDDVSVMAGAPHICHSCLKCDSYSWTDGQSE